MSDLKKFRKVFSEKELRVFEALDKPWKIQWFLDNKLSYNKGDECFSPKMVLKFRMAACFDGALFAAAVLRFHGFKPLVIGLRAVEDEDHILAVFKSNGRWGSIGKSKFFGLRFRDPVFKSIRELALSYFNNYFNYNGKKTLREFSVPLNLSVFDKDGWMNSEKPLWFIGEKLDKTPHKKVLDKKSISHLSKVESLRLKSEITVLPSGKRDRKKVLDYSKKFVLPKSFAGL